MSRNLRVRAPRAPLGGRLAPNCAGPTILNPATKRCVRVDSKNGRAVLSMPVNGACRAGTALNGKRRCVPPSHISAVMHAGPVAPLNYNGEDLDYTPLKAMNPCPVGHRRNPMSNRCVTIRPQAPDATWKERYDELMQVHRACSAADARSTGWKTGGVTTCFPRPGLAPAALPAAPVLPVPDQQQRVRQMARQRARQQARLQQQRQQAQALQDFDRDLHDQQRQKERALEEEARQRQNQRQVEGQNTDERMRSELLQQEREELRREQHLQQERRELMQRERERQLQRARREQLQRQREQRDLQQQRERSELQQRERHAQQLQRERREQQERRRSLPGPDESSDDSSMQEEKEDPDWLILPQLPPAVGLHNQGIACYILAPLQAFLRVRCILRYVINSEPDAKRQPFLSLLKKIFLQMIAAKPNEQEAPFLEEESVDEIINEFRDIAKKYKNGQETFQMTRMMDATEALAAFLDWVSIEERAVFKSDADRKKSDINLPLSGQWTGFIQFQRTCQKCGLESVAEPDLFQTLTLDCEADGKKCVSLDDCIRFKTASTVLEKRCTRCSHRANQNHKVSLKNWEIPPTLIIHLKRLVRINNRNKKHTHPIKAPLILNVRGRQYQRQSAVIHSGCAANKKGGHYTIITRGGGDWRHEFVPKNVEIDDDEVSDTDDNSKKWHTALFYVYQRIPLWDEI